MRIWYKGKAEKEFKSGKVGDARRGLNIMTGRQQKRIRLFDDPHSFVNSFGVVNSDTQTESEPIYFIYIHIHCIVFVLCMFLMGTNVCSMCFIVSGCAVLSDKMFCFFFLCQCQRRISVPEIWTDKVKPNRQAKQISSPIVMLLFVKPQSSFWEKALVYYSLKWFTQQHIRRARANWS